MRPFVLKVTRQQRSRFFYYGIFPHVAFDMSNRLVDALNLPYCYKLEMNFDISDWCFERRNIFLREETVLSSNLLTFLRLRSIATRFQVSEFLQ